MKKSFDKNALPDNALREHHLSVNAVTTYAQNTSHPRLDMGFSLASQSLVLIEPDRKNIQNGFDIDVVDTTDNITAPENCIIRKIIQKTDSEANFILIYESLEISGKIGMIEITRYKSLGVKAGFELHPTELLKTVRENKVYNKGEILAISRSVKHGSYDNGLYANVVFMDSRSVPDDSIEVSDAWLDKAKYNVYRTFTIEVTENDHLRNLYGTKDYYQPLPNEGDSIREDNVLAAKVGVDINNMVSILDPDTPDNINPITDSIYYDRNTGESVIESVDIIHNGLHSKDVSTEQDSQLKRLVMKGEQYYKDIAVTYASLKKEITGMGGTIILTDDLATLVERAIVMTSSSNVKLTKKQGKLPKYLITIVTKKTMGPKQGAKVSPTTAGKGIFCKVTPKDKMPRDQNGTVADIAIYHGSVVNRLTPSSYYEQYIMSMLMDMSKKLRILFLGNDVKPRRMNLAISSVKDASETVYKKAVSELLDFYQVISHPVYDAFKDAIDQKREEDIIHHLAECLLLNVTIYHTADYLSSRPLIQIVKDAEKSPFRPCYDKIWVCDKNGEFILTKKKIRIGPIYMLIINKKGDEISSSNSIRQNTYGVAGNSDSSEGDLSLFSGRNLTSTGRMESPFLFSIIGPEASAEYHDTMSNPFSIAHLTSRMLDRNMGKESAINRRVVKHTDSRALKIIRHFLQCTGVEFTYLPEPKSKRL